MCIQTYMQQLQQLLHWTDRQIISNTSQRTHHSHNQIAQHIHLLRTRHKRQPQLQQHRHRHGNSTHPTEKPETNHTRTIRNIQTHKNTPTRNSQHITEFQNTHTTQTKPEDARTSLALKMAPLSKLVS